LFDALSIPHPEQLRLLAYTKDDRSAIENDWGDFYTDKQGRFRAIFSPSLTRNARMLQKITSIQARFQMVTEEHPRDMRTRLCGEALRDLSHKKAPGEAGAFFSLWMMFTR
jgi:hypothetical protein